MRETGRLDLIRDAQLRSDLVSYFERTQEQFFQELSDWLDVREALIAEYNEYWIFSASDTVSSVFQGSGDLDYTFDWPALTGDRAAMTIAVRYSGLAAVTARRAGSLLEANAELGRSIDVVLSAR